ncbi:glycosyl hydrolase family 18 protein [soil metagenome]
MKKTNYIILPIFILFFSNIFGQSADQDFKVVGYYSLNAAMTVNPDTVPYDRLTHINLWFLNPDSLGNFQQDLSTLNPFIQAAHDKNTKVLASIGGGSRQPYYARLLQTEHRAAFIKNLVAVAERYHLDGIDVDLEGKDIDDNYEKFVVELAEALKAQNKLITAAIAVYYKDMLTDKALAQYDFVNIMSYDRTGPWTPEKPGPHATFTHAVQDLEYFGTERGIPKEKMTLGVPFYGYGYDLNLQSPAVSMNYRQIVSTFSGSENVDEWLMPDGKILYYNGVHTIRQKTALAKDKASGIMIWQILGDAPGSESLLKAINDVANGEE